MNQKKNKVFPAQQQLTPATTFHRVNLASLSFISTIQIRNYAEFKIKGNGVKNFLIAALLFATIGNVNAGNIFSRDNSEELEPSTPPKIMLAPKKLKIQSKLKFESFLRQLEYDPEYREAAQGIRELDCKGCELSMLHRGIRHLKNLESLDLRDNKFATFSTEISWLENLEQLDLSNNQLTELPETICALLKLKTLHLVENNFTIFPKYIEWLDLESLILSNNNLTTLPQEIIWLENLKTLGLSNNQLRTLPPEIGNLKNLTSLGLSGNRLTELPSEILNLNNLRLITLSSPLTSLLQQLWNMPGIREIWLSNFDDVTKLIPPEILPPETIRRHTKENKFTTIECGTLQITIESQP